MAQGVRALMCLAAIFGLTATALAEVTLSAKATGPGGLLRFSGGEAAAEVALETSEPTTLTAEPQSGYFFYRWLGDIAGYDEEALTNATLSLDATTSRSLRAVFLRQTGTGSAEFANAVSECDWFDATSWKAGEIPVAGDAVSMVIKNGNRKIILSAPTPHYKSVIFSSFDFQSALGTLVMTNWTTKLKADDIVIDKKATVKCSPCVAGVASNRVWLVCKNLRIDPGTSGGRINVSDCGWGTLTGPGVTVETKCGPQYVNAGAAHGGHGTLRFNDKQSMNVVTGNNVKVDCGYLMPPPYGSASYPVDPGSGGNLGPGGGAVLIEATGTVVVNGSILANATTTGFSSGHGAGSGGSICITCARFIGTNGLVQANSIHGQTNWNTAEGNDLSLPGGGGRIAIHYDTTQQQLGDLVNVGVSAAPGTLYERFSNGTRPANYRSPTVADRMWQVADLGSVWFTDATLPKDILGSSLTGQIVSPSSFALDALTFTNGHVRFAAEGVSVTVAGDAVISGATVRVEFGGSYSTNWCVGTQLRAKTPWTFTVGGNLALAEGARLDARGAATNGLGNVGGLVKVSGTMSLAGYTNAYAVVKGTTWAVGPTTVYAWSDAFNGGSPVFEVGSLVVASNAVFTADKRGFASGSSIAAETVGGVGYSVHGYGPGGGESKSSGGERGGGGHGGFGGWGGTTPVGNRCGTYDDVCRPTLAGSGGAGIYSLQRRAYGGGVVNVTATGMIRVDGRVSADGENANNFSIAGGAGGTVFLSCKRFVGTEAGVLAANGGGAQCAPTASKWTGAGGGGRIAVWAGAPWTETAKLRHCTTNDVPLASAAFDYKGTTSVLGGVPTEAGDRTEQYSGKPGTVRFCRYNGIPGFMLILRSQAGKH